MSGSHLIVFGTSIWCLFQVDKSAGFKFVYVSYITMCCYSLTGVMRYGSRRYGPNLANVYEFADVAVQCLVLPGLVTDLYDIYGYEWVYAKIHFLLSFIPLSAYVLGGSIDQELIDFFVLLNTVSLLVVSTIKENTYGVFSVITYFLTHFLMPEPVIEGSEDISRKFAYNIWLSWFSYFSYRTIAEALGHK